jgi:phage terminase large subunit GpA-like protein
VAFEDSVANTTHETSVLVCGSQMGKTDGLIDIMGWRLDTRPRPQLYVGPSKDFVEDQFSPRLTTLISETASLAAKASKRREKRTLKIIAGVPVRLAWAGSATQLSSDSFGDVYVDEIDRMGVNIQGEGDPLAMAKARSFTYRDRKMVVTSTPLVGTVDVAIDPQSRLQFWKKSDPDDIRSSAVWKLFQAGTMGHWAWPCPHCEEYFIPRFSCLKWPKIDGRKRISAAEAVDEAYVECLLCEGHIREHHKSRMNARGVFVCPGQSIDLDGSVYGEMPKSRIMSFWVSGLASPFVTIGERAAAFIEALDDGTAEKMQGVINTGFGELFSPGTGEAPEWSEVLACKAPYVKRTVPDGVRVLLLSVDVQKNRMPYVIRGWGERGTSWKIDADELHGETQYPDVWSDLEDLMHQTFDGLPIRMGLIDSGFRPGKKDIVPVHMVYEFCRKYPRFLRASKGSSAPMRKPMVHSKIDIMINGKEFKQGLDLLRLDTDYFKSWVHERIRWPKDKPGAWFVPDDVSEDYCMQIVSEARSRNPSGVVKWVARSKENHFLDCEAMQVAAAMSLNLFKLTAGDQVRTRSSVQRPKTENSAPAVFGAAEQAIKTGVRESTWLEQESIW